MEFNFPKLTVPVLKEELSKAFLAGAFRDGNGGVANPEKSVRDKCNEDFNKYWRKNNSEIIKRSGIPVTGQKVKVVLVTKLDPTNLLYNEFKPYAWQEYDGWTGRIIKESTNGGIPAWYVKISGDGNNFVKMSINKMDLEICQ